MGDGIATRSLWKVIKQLQNVGFGPVEAAEIIPATDGLGAFIYLGHVSVYLPISVCCRRML